MIFFEKGGTRDSLRVVDKVDALLDVAREVLVGDLEELLLLVVGLADDVDGLLGAGGLEKRISMGYKWKD